MGMNWQAARLDIERAARKKRRMDQRPDPIRRGTTLEEAKTSVALRNQYASEADTKRIGIRQAGLDRQNALELERTKNKGSFDVANLQYGRGGSTDRTNSADLMRQNAMETGALARSKLQFGPGGSVDRTTNMQFGPGSAVQRGVDLESKKKTYEPIQNELGATVGYQGFNQYGEDPAASSLEASRNADAAWIKSFDTKHTDALVELFNGYDEAGQKNLIDTMAKHNPELLKKFRNKLKGVEGDGPVGGMLAGQRLKDRGKTNPFGTDYLKKRYEELKRGNFWNMKPTEIGR